MFEKVLVAEDMDDISKGVVSTLTELGIKNIDQVQYCDDAHLKILKAEKDQAPYDLLITDLSFSSDHRHQKISGGDQLARLVKRDHPELKIIMYSVEDRLQMVRSMFERNGVDAYVCKGRHGLKDLSMAIEQVYQGEQYLSPWVAHALHPRQKLDIDDFDLLVIEKLSQGLSQDEISAVLKKRAISPNSLSTIEKRLNRLKIEFKANNTVHLVSKVKDLGLI